MKCGKLKCFPEGLTAGLRKLCIGGFGEELKSLPHQLQHLTALTTLRIYYFDGLEVLPDWLGNFSSLQVLYITSCRNLMYLPTLEAMQRLTALTTLKIFRCPSLESIPTIHGLTFLRKLEIGGFGEEVKSLPHQLQHLTALITLRIEDFDGVEALPDWLGNLSSLQYLNIRSCKTLMYLPTLEAMQRLTKLQKLVIEGCPLLKERCAKDSGPEWSKISHIIFIYIDGRLVQDLDPWTDAS